MFSTIDYTTTYACNLLDASISGTVHSVYQKTINLQVGSYLLSIQAAGSPVSPLSLIANLNAFSLDCLAISPGQAITINNSRICLSAHVFSWKEAHVYDTTLTATLSACQQSRLRNEVATAIADSSNAGFQPLFTVEASITCSALLSVAKNRILACHNYVLSHSYDQAAKALVGLLGLGIGLTPSGDDFLCGVLAGLQLQAMRNHPFSRALRQQIQAHIGDTNDISRAFLSCALQNEYSMAIKALPTLASSIEIRTIFDTIGHSSGTDTLCGVLYGLNLFA